MKPTIIGSVFILMMFYEFNFINDGCYLKNYESLSGILSKMLEGKCPKCGYEYIGWALRYERHQTCTKCCEELDIVEYGHRIRTGYSPLSEDGLVGTPKDQEPTSEQSKKSHRGKWNWILHASNN